MSEYKPFQRKITDEQALQVVQSLAEGEDRDDIAERHGISVVYVGQIGRTRRTRQGGER